jgi:DNA repair exonuclease SbcCD ATPase subunit
MKNQSEMYPRQKSELDELDKKHKDMSGFQIEINLLQPKVDGIVSNLPENWKKEADDFTEIRLKELQNEKTTLNKAPQKFTELQQAQSEKNAQQKRFDEIIEELENITESARRPASVIEEEITQLKQEKIKAEGHKNTAAARKSELETQQLRRAELEKEQKEVRHKAALYRELSNLLGRDALQRWLLRGAEETIVHNANGFLERISNRSIELKLKTSASDEGNIEAGTKALDLMANYQIEEGNYALLPVDSLSGGQRFRVAVSLALGIGQYASTGTRRLESVIIDEGFGSLDVDGRNEMIDEIKSLKDILQRIIIVSHQEEVAKAFPTNKYAIRKVNGTSTVELVDGYE